MKEKFLCVLFCCTPSVGFAQLEPPVQPVIPPLDYVIGRVAQKTQDDLALRRDLFTYRKTMVYEDMDHPADQRVTLREESIIYGRGGKSYQKKTSKDGVPVARPKEELVKFELDETFIKRYVFALADKPYDKINGRPCYVLTFSPSGGDFPERTEQEWALNRLSGTMCVDAEEFFVVRFAGHLTKEHRKGFIGKVLTCEVTVEQEKLSAIAVPRTIVSTFRYSVVGFETSVRQTITYSGFELIQRTSVQPLY